MYYALNGVRGDPVLNRVELTQIRRAQHAAPLQQHDVSRKSSGDFPASLAAEPLDQALRRCMNQLKAEAIDLTGSRVDYAGLKSSPTFATYRSLAACLQSFELRTLTTHESRMAFWLNLYNALILHTVIDLEVRQLTRFSDGRTAVRPYKFLGQSRESDEHQPSPSISNQRGFFDRAAYYIGGYRFSANEIEHGILRCNRSHPLIPGPVFEADDPRRGFVLERFDPRLHAALNCAARSCPPINFYDPERLDVQLDLAMRSFINGGGLDIDRVHRAVSLSRIFSWYASDFGGAWFGYRGAGHLIGYVLPYVQSTDDRAWLEANLPALRVRFLPYDWSLNA
jgi:hypothetical protein